MRVHSGDEHPEDGASSQVREAARAVRQHADAGRPSLDFSSGRNDTDANGGIADTEGDVAKDDASAMLHRPKASLVRDQQPSEKRERLTRGASPTLNIAERADTEVCGDAREERESQRHRAGDGVRVPDLAASQELGNFTTGA